MGDYSGQFGSAVGTMASNLNNISYSMVPNLMPWVTTILGIAATFAIFKILTRKA